MTRLNGTVRAVVFASSFLALPFGAAWATGDGYGYTDRPMNELAEIEAGLSHSEGHDAEFIVGLRYEGGRIGEEEDGPIRKRERLFPVVAKIGINAVHGSPAMYEVEVVPYRWAIGLEGLELLGFEVLPMGMRSSVRLNEGTNYSIDLVAARVNVPVMALAESFSEEQGLMLIAGLGARALGATYVEYTGGDQSFGGAHIGDVSGEMSLLYAMPDGLTFTLALGGEAGVSIGGTAAANTSVRAELERYLALKANFGTFMQVFGQAGARTIIDSGNDHRVTVRELLLGARFYF